MGSPGGGSVTGGGSSGGVGGSSIGLFLAGGGLLVEAAFARLTAARFHRDAAMTALPARRHRRSLDLATQPRIRLCKMMAAALTLSKTLFAEKQRAAA